MAPVVKIHKQGISPPIVKNGGARGPTFADSGGASSSSPGKPVAQKPTKGSQAAMRLAAGGRT